MEIYYKGILQDNNGKPDSEMWLTVFLKNEPIGIIMPHVFQDIKTEGTILFIGLKSQYRNLGYGKILHSKCLEILKQNGVQRYIGSTLETNIAMNAVFQKNNCNYKMTRFFYKLL